jgi:hypothetical protein
MHFATHQNIALLQAQLGALRRREHSFPPLPRGEAARWSRGDEKDRGEVLENPAAGAVCVRFKICPADEVEASDALE